jgi:hypothetical protein
MEHPLIPLHEGLEELTKVGYNSGLPRIDMVCGEVHHIRMLFLELQELLLNLSGDMKVFGKCLKELMGLLIM